MTEQKSLLASLLLAAMLVLLPCSAPAQQAGGSEAETAGQPPDDTGEADAENAASRETEISEDNYRRFMELDDQPIERAMPIMQAPAQPGLENMQRLPESSQKHLREQLREIILGSGAWTPARMNDDYPFVPSEAGKADAGLRQLEATAWQELVAQYHAREAEILAGRQGGAGATQAAGMDGQAGAQQGQNKQAGQQGQQSQAGQQGQGSEAGQQAGSQQNQDSTAQASEQARQQRQSQPGSSATRPGQSQYRPPPEGTEQSALEFLTGQTGGNSGRPAAGNSGRQPAGRLSLEQLEQVPGIGRVSIDEDETDPADTQGEPPEDDG
jgi:hypothetical protein